MRTSSIFKSRWMALIWAAGIIWLAMDVADRGASADANSGMSNNSTMTDDDGNPVSNEDVATAEKAFGL